MGVASIFAPALCQAQAPAYIITTFAGNNTAGYTADAVAATTSELNNPLGMALDSSGNLYIADQLNHRVREVTGGTISTVAGDGTAGYLGDAAAATSAELDLPSGVAVDSSGNSLHRGHRQLRDPQGVRRHHHDVRGQQFSR